MVISPKHYHGKNTNSAVNSNTTSSCIVYKLHATSSDEPEAKPASRTTPASAPSPPRVEREQLAKGSSGQVAKRWQRTAAHTKSRQEVTGGSERNDLRTTWVNLWSYGVIRALAEPIAISLPSRSLNRSRPPQAARKFTRQMSGLGELGVHLRLRKSVRKTGDESDR